MSDLAGNSEDRLYHDAAHIMALLVPFKVFKSIYKNNDSVWNLFS